MGKPTLEKRVRELEEEMSEATLTLEDIKTNVERIHTRLDSGDITINIKNGKLTGEYKLNDFMQVLYDRPKETLKRSSIIADQLYKIIIFVGSLGMIVYWVLKILKIII